MLARFLRDSAAYGLTSVLVRGVSLILVPLYTRVLTPRDYGIVDILTVTSAIVAVTVALEISQALARFLPDAHDDMERSAYASTALWFTLAMYALFAVLVVVFAAPLSAIILDDASHQTIILIALPTVVGSGVFYLVQNQLRFQLRVRQYVVSSATYTLVGIAFTVLFVLALRWGVIGVFAGQTVGAAVGISLSFAYARDVYRPVVDWTRLREMLAFSVPLIPSSVGVFIALYVDRIAVKELMSLADLGLFGIGYRVASVVSLVMIGFQAALTPLVYTHYRQSETPRELARVFSFFMGLAIVIALTLSLFSREIVMTLTTPAYYEGAVVVPLLVPALLLSNMYIFAPGLGIAKRTGITSMINLSGAALNTALNLVLVPRLGIEGAATATLISAAAVFTAYVITGQRHYRVPYQWGPIAIAVVIGVIVYGLGSLLAPGGMSVPLKALMILGVGLSTLALGLVPVAETRRALSRFLSRESRGRMA